MSKPAPHTEGFTPSPRLVSILLKEIILSDPFINQLAIPPGTNLILEMRGVMSGIAQEAVAGLFHTMARSLSNIQKTSYTIGAENAFDHAVGKALAFRLGSRQPGAECMHLFYTEVFAAAASGALKGPHWKVEARPDNTLVLVVTEPWPVKPPAPPRERAKVVRFPEQDDV